MARTVRLIDLTLGVEGLALLRSLFDDDADTAHARVAEAVRLGSDERLRTLGIEFPERAFDAGYAEWSTIYDDMPNGLIDVEQAAVESLLAGLPAGRALDAACGTGRITALLVARGHEVTGVDATPEMLAIARRKLPGVVLHEARLERLPFEDESFDLVTCALALAHLEDLDPAVTELARVARRGGRVILTDIHPFAVLLAGQASYVTATGTGGVVRNFVHLSGAYLESFRRRGLQVRCCVEPVHTEATVSHLPCFGVAPDATRQAFCGLPLALVWELERTR